jgi:acyl-CoA hydrolase
VDELYFHYAIKYREFAALQGSLNRVLNASLEVGVRMTKEDPLTSERKHTDTAYLTFVSIHEQGKSVLAYPIRPVTNIEKRRYRNAVRRLQLSLLYRQRG